MNTTNRLQRALNWSVAFVLLCIAAGGVARRCHAESVMKMTLGPSDTGNMQFENSIFSMLGDGLAGSPGDLDMTIDYVIGNGGGGGLQAFSADNPTGKASVTLGGMTVAAAPTSTGSFIVQPFTSGGLAVFDDNNRLLLSATLTKSGLQGALGPGDKQGLFVGFGHVTGGSIARLLDPGSLQLRIKFPKIAGGFSVSAPPNSHLNDFTTWTSSVEILATPVPEPSFAVLLCAVAWTFVPVRRKRRG